jgi:hypothetical protein
MLLIPSFYAHGNQRQAAVSHLNLIIAHLPNYLFPPPLVPSKIASPPKKQKVKKDKALSVFFCTAFQRRFNWLNCRAG